VVEIGANVRPGQGLAAVIGAGGMAMAIARRLGNSHRILLADQDGEHLARQVEALRAEGHDACGVVCEVTDLEAVGRLAEECQQSGSVQAIAHVVGLSPSMADAETILRVNLIGPTLVADAFVGLARIGTAAVFIASLAGHLIDVAPTVQAALSDPLAPDFVDRVKANLKGELSPALAYQLSKAAVVRMCQQRVRAWAERGARIVSLSPGMIATPMGALELVAQPEKRRLLEAAPLGREGTMIEIADAVEFLVSDRASYITGTDILVDGGVAAAMRHDG
jgi:NAD(P)-dependent dehydrogenase (short-subunit alcohol dehydrogenase family)